MVNRRSDTDLQSVQSTIFRPFIGYHQMKLGVLILSYLLQLASGLRFLEQLLHRPSMENLVHRRPTQHCAAPAVPHTHFHYQANNGHELLLKTPLQLRPTGSAALFAIRHEAYEKAHRR